MPLLESLPNEVLGEIFSYLPCKYLARNSLASRRLCAISVPYLYRTLLPTSWGLRILLRTLLSRPILANYVRSLAFDWTSLDARSNRLHLTDLTLLTAAAERFGLEYSLDSRGTQLILLLHLLPCLEHLNLRPPHHYDGFDEFMDNQAYLSSDTLPIGLRSVREIRCYWPCMDTSVTPESLLTMMLLPAIRVLDIQMMADMKIHGVELNEWTGMSAITDLGFGKSDIKAWSLERILKIPKALERFSYEYSTADGTWCFDAPGVGRALELHRQTLQYLVLVFGDGLATEEEDGDDGDDGMGIVSAIGSLREWPVLCKIKCSLTLLLGKGPEVAVARLVDVLPLAIREFAVDTNCFWARYKIADELVHMLELRKVRGLHWLKVLDLGWYMDDEEERVRASCEAAGVSLVVRSSDW